MKKVIISISILVILLFVTHQIIKRKGILLGKIPARPPKVRIVYSKKQKSSESSKISNSSDTVEILREVWSSQIEVREEFMVLLLDRANQVLGYELLSKGGISGTVADIRLIFSVALQSLASSIIIAHNHPSGNVKPSETDIRLTRRIKEVGENMDIKVLDHLILTKESFYSFADEGYL